MLQELLLDTEQIPSGWALVRANLGRRGSNLVSSIRLHRDSDSGPGEEIPLPALADGRIFELIQLPRNVGRLVWRPPQIGEYHSSQVSIRPIGWIERVTLMAVRVVRTWLRLSEDERRECGLLLPRALFDLAGAYRIATGFRVRLWTQPYSEWLERYDALGEEDRRLIRAHIQRFAAPPRFHVLVAAQKGGKDALEHTLASLRAQLYDRWECAAVGVGGTIAERPADSAGNGPAISVVPGDAEAGWLADFNGRLAEAGTNAWIMLLRAGDTLPAHALYWFACEVQSRPDAAVAYSDDDAVDASGRRNEPRFKPDWSPEHFRATHYIGSAAIVRADVLAAAGGISADCCRHGNYDLLLRAADASGGRLAHVPAVLLHRGRAAATDWEHPQWCVSALQAHLARNGLSADVAAVAPAARRIRYRLPDPPPLVSIIVPTRDAAPLLQRCIQSVLEKTTYPRYEVVVVDNRSAEPDALSYLDRISAYPSVRVLRYPQAFNYSAINNFAVRQARGEALCLLNNDTEVISPDWLEEMVGHLSQAGVGAVGAKLYYPDGRVQHAGVTVGPGGCATHLHLDLDRGTGGYCGRAAVAQELSAVTGACLLTWKDLYERLGGLNEERLTVAFNDIDYCLRLQEAGCRVVFTPHAELYHHESATRGNDEPLARRLRARREVKFMRKRWGQRLRHDPYYNPNLSYRRPDFALGESSRVRKPWRDGE